MLMKGSFIIVIVKASSFVGKNAHLSPALGPTVSAR